MRFISQYKGLPKEIYIILLARIIGAMGMFVYPFLTLFLSSRMGFSEVKIGMFMLIVSLSYIPAAMIGGKLADRFNRRITYFIAVFSGDALLLMAGFLYPHMSMIYLLLASFFFINMSMPVLSAMMMDLTSPVNRQESFSLIYLGLNIGGAVGPMAAGFLFENYTRWIFYGDALLSLCALFLVFLFVKDTKPDRETMERISMDESRRHEAASDKTLLQLLIRSPILIAFALCYSLLGYSYSQVSFILPLQMEDIFGLGDGARFFGILCSLNCLVVVAATPFLVLITKKNRPLTNVSVSAFLYMIGFGLYGVTDRLLLFYLFTVIWTVGEIVSATNAGVYIANHSPVTHRAQFQSIFDIIQGIGRAVGPLTIGYFLIRHTIDQAWGLVAFLCLIAGIALLILRKLER